MSGKPDDSDSGTHGTSLWPQVDEAEKERIRTARNDDEKNKWTGFGISGGGVRSATFNLGVVQAMEVHGVLDEVDYMSTVSGGGYIGSSLTWFKSKKVWFDKHPKLTPKQKVDYSEFPFGEERSDNKQLPGKIVSWLRRHASFLTPGHGLGTASLICAVLRGTLVNLLYILPILFACVYVLSAKLPEGVTNAMKFIWENPVVVFVLTKLTIDDTPPITTLNLFFFLGVILLTAVAALFFLSSLGSRYDQVSDFPKRRELYRWLGLLLTLGTGLLLVGAGSLIVENSEMVKNNLKQASTTLVSSGAGAFLLAYLGRKKADERGKIIKCLILAGLILFNYGLLLGMIHLSTFVRAHDFFEFPLSVPLLGLIPPLLIFGFADVNHVSMHRYYRDRLLEAYMPRPEDAEKAYKDPTHKPNFKEPSGFCLHETPATQLPYHIINTNMVTVDSKRTKLRGRGGENFIFSPLYCGSENTSYIKTTTEGPYREMNLATAFSISGAAVSPNNGATRSKPLAFFMTLINARLGYWISNPHPDKRSFLKLEEKSRNYSNVFKEMLGWNLNEEQSCVNLTDGGHYENLAMYELVRRECDFIIISDAGADPDWKFSDLARAIELVRVDFGAAVEINTQPIRPNPETGISETAFQYGKITYESGKEGTLLYIKTTVIAGLPEDIYGYKRVNESFPDESTSDQFFDERQFEAYRELGYQIGKRAFDPNAQKSDAEAEKTDTVKVQKFDMKSKGITKKIKKPTAEKSKTVKLKPAKAKVSKAKVSKAKVSKAKASKAKVSKRKTR